MLADVYYSLGKCQAWLPLRKCQEGFPLTNTSVSIPAHDGLIGPGIGILCSMALSSPQRIRILEGLCVTREC